MSSGRVSRGSMISSTRNASAVRKGERTALSRSSISRRFSVESVSVITHRDIKVTPEGGGFLVVADYDHTSPFIGNVYFDQLACLQQQARLIEAEAFEFNIDTHGYFSKPRVAWLGCSEPPKALAELHRQLGQRLRHCDYQPEKRRYNSHVTVARKIQSLPEHESFESISWKVENFALVEVCQTASGVQYRVNETFPLI